MAAGGDPEHRGLARQRAPERPASAGGLPAGLVDVDDRRCFDLLLEPGVRRRERLTRALDDRVDRPARQLDPEQLTRELGRVAAGDTVPDRKRHDRSLQPWPKRRPRQLAGKLGARLGRAAGTADTVQPMLAHPDGGRRQLRELVSPRLRDIDALPYAERVRARPAAV